MEYSNLKIIGEGSYGKVYVDDNLCYKLPHNLKCNREIKREMKIYLNLPEKIKSLIVPIKGYKWNNLFGNIIISEKYDDTVYNILALANYKAGIEILKKTIDLIQTLHKNDYCHGDLHLENIVVKLDNDIKIKFIDTNKLINYKKCNPSIKSCQDYLYNPHGETIFFIKQIKYLAYDEDIKWLKFLFLKKYPTTLTNFTKQLEILNY